MKKTVLFTILVLAISLPFVSVTAQITVTPDSGTGDVTPKEKDKYELTSVHSDDKVNVDISSSPTARMYKWGREAYLDVSYPSLAVSPTKELNDNKVTWRDGNIEIHQYLGDPTEQFEDGVFEFEVILHSKPASNQIILDIETRGLVFYYQPALTVEEIANGDTRPDNIVGSYAVYHDSKRNNQYKTGKAFHIPRPQPIDADEKTVWADLLIENGQMIVTIPQKFLDEAVYPVRHATGATFGFTGTGNTGITVGLDFIFGSGTMFNPGISGVAISMSAYISDNGEGFKMGLYDSDDNLVGNTTEVDALAALSWVTANFTSDPNVSSNTYYRAVVWSDENMTLRGDASGGKQVFEAIAYGNPWPDPASWTEAGTSRIYSIYTTYTPTAGRILNISVDGKVLVGP